AFATLESASTPAPAAALAASRPMNARRPRGAASSSSVFWDMRLSWRGVRALNGVECSGRYAGPYAIQGLGRTRLDGAQSAGLHCPVPMDTIFLLSPARCDGRRARILLSPKASFELAARVHGAGGPIGEVFSFLSGLYFRGKVAYARAFGRRADDAPSSF